MRNGDVYATDSAKPNLYRIPADASKGTETIVYPDFNDAPGAFNANGIASSMPARWSLSTPATAVSTASTRSESGSGPSTLMAAPSRSATG